MDTKLKNNHKYGIYIILTITALASVCMMSLYPFFARHAKSYIEPPYREHYFAERIMNSYWYLYTTHELNIQEDAKSAADVLLALPDFEKGSLKALTEDEQINLNNLKESINNDYRNWKSSYLNLISEMEIEMLDTNGTIIQSNSKNSLYQSILDGKMDDYAFYVAININQNSLASVTKIHGIQSDELFTTYMNTLDNDSFDYVNNYDTNLKITMNEPANMNFVFAMTNDTYQQLLAQSENAGYPYYNSGAVYSSFSIIMLLLIALAVILPFIPVFSLKDSKVFAVPLEIALFVLSMVIVFAQSISIDLVSSTNNGELYTGILHLGLPAVLCQAAVLGLNFIVWFLLFLITYWMISCMRAVFTMGFVDYMKERCLICKFWGSICRFVKKITSRTYELLMHVDLNNHATKSILKIIGINFIILTICCSIWFFGIFALVVYSVLLFFFLNKYVGDLKLRYQTLLKATNEIAEGNLDVTITEDLGIFEPFKEVLGKIQKGFKVAVEEEVKSQRMKTELITNVSHDLKTPLTAIITYVNLLKENDLTEEQRNSYISVLEQKSMRLKFLIEDLFEVTKANTQNITLDLMDVDIISLLKQVRMELSDKIDNTNLIFRWELPDKRLLLHLDNQKTYRIFENLLNNILKYSMDGTRVYVQLEESDNNVTIYMKNISSTELSISGLEVTERFVRGDSSRNTEGSGLGLAIAKSFTEVQGGTMDVEIDGDLFKVMIQFPKIMG